MNRNNKESVEDYFTRIQKEYRFKNNYQDVGLRQIDGVLSDIGLKSLEMRDAVWCLLNDELPCLFSGSEGYFLKDGASISHIATFIGILVRNKTKLDREGRDYWIKPLRSLGAIEAITFSSETGFIVGHVKAKSPNSSYRLHQSFLILLQQQGQADYQSHFKEWTSEDSVRSRLKVLATAEKASKDSIEGNPHETLINYSIEVYAKHFLPGYIVIYKDDADGDRISKEETALMEKFGIKLALEDVFPDVILYNEEDESLWFVEAVTSDGEVDEHKLSGLREICRKSGKKFGGATTTYLTWKSTSSRQKSYQNLGDTSKLWIVEDPQKEFEVQYHSPKNDLEI